MSLRAVLRLKEEALPRTPRCEEAVLLDAFGRFLEEKSENGEVKAKDGGTECRLSPLRLVPVEHSLHVLKP